MLWPWLALVALPIVAVCDIVQRRRKDNTLRRLVRSHLAQQTCHTCGMAHSGWDGRLHDVGAFIDYVPGYRGPFVCRELWLTCRTCGRPAVFWVRSDGTLSDVSGFYVESTV